MSGLFFSNAALLAGLGALAVPILIHLLLKQKKRPLRFSTLQFFLKRDEPSARRRKLRNWLLLTLRLLLLALLVLAFARPYLRESTAERATGQPRQIVVVLDRSASMQAGDRWAKAGSLLRATLAGMDSADRIALIDSGPTAEIISPLVSPDDFKPILQKLAPGFGTSDLAAGLKAAVGLLASFGAGDTLRIQVISDLQTSACAGLAEAAVPQRIELFITPVAETVVPNLALRDLNVDHAASTVTVNIGNYATPATGDVPLNLAIDGATVATPALAVPAETSTQWSFSLPQLTPGWHSVTARLAAHDTFAVDDVRYHTLFIPQPLRVLCPEEQPDRHAFEQESFFVSSALAPDTNNGALYLVDKATPDEAPAKLATGNYALVVLPGLRRIPPPLAGALMGFVTNGGGLILFMGEKLDAGRYSDEFHDLLPALPGNIEGEETQPENFWHLRNYDRASLIFAAFQEPNSGDVTLPEFRRRFALAPLGDSHVDASFNDGTPLVISKRLGRGRVVLVNTSADTDWTDWPKRKTFVPWLDGLAAYAMQQPLSREVENDMPMLAGAPADVPMGTAVANMTLQVRGPAGQAVSLVADAQGEISLNPERPGFYSLQDSSGHELQRLAVNLAAAESDLRSLTPGDLHIPRTTDVPQPSLVAGVLGGGHRELWRTLMLSVLALLFVEPLLANRSYA